MNYSNFVNDKFMIPAHDATDKEKAILHAVMGVATESHELLESVSIYNSLEELGDLFFYTQAVHNTIYGDDSSAIDAISEWDTEATKETNTSLQGYAIDLLDMVKKAHLKPNWVEYLVTSTDFTEKLQLLVIESIRVFTRSVVMNLNDLAEFINDIDSGEKDHSILEIYNEDINILRWFNKYDEEKILSHEFAIELSKRIINANVAKLSYRMKENNYANTVEEKARTRTIERDVFANNFINGAVEA